MLPHRVLFVAVAALALLASSAWAQKKPVPPSKEIAGSVDDENLMKNAPPVVTTAKGLEKVWKDWKIADPMPPVDFAKDMVVLTTTRGSKLKLLATLDDKGDLQIGGLATRDLRPGFRYVIAVVPKEGVKTVNGKELPKE